MWRTHVRNSSWTSVWLFLLLNTWANGGCGCDQNQTCETPMTDQQAAVSQAVLPQLWTGPQGTSLTLLMADSPYSIPDDALEPVLRALADQVGIGVTVQRVSGPANLGPDQTVTRYQATVAGCNLPWSGSGPMAAVVTVWDVGGGYGSFNNCYSDLMRSTVVIHRAGAVNAAFGPLRPEDIEALSVLHELGHWFGVPARDFHKSSVDSEHCTDGQCVMFKGSRLNTCAVFSNLLTGLPFHFCPDCAEELVEEQNRRLRAGQ